MAVLISKVVRSSSSERVDGGHFSSQHKSNRTNVNRSTNPFSLETNITGGNRGGLGDENKGAGIVKTVKTVTTVVKNDGDGDTYEGYQLSTKSSKSLTEDFPSYNSSISSPA
jgi:hypothetical protein